MGLLLTTMPTALASAMFFRDMEKRFQKSIEGFAVIFSNLHGETEEEDILNLVEEIAEPLEIHLNLDRRTGYVKGYCFLLFEDLDVALSIIKQFHDADLLGKKVQVDLAFCNPKYSRETLKNGRVVDL